MKTLLFRILIGLVILAGAFAYLGRGPDYTIEWKREVPSKESFGTLAAALDDPRKWSIFHHALKSVTFTDGGQPAPAGTRVSPGMTALFAIEPKAKEWKRFEIQAEILEVKPGESVKFRLLRESTGKTTRIVEDLEWAIGIRPATEAEAKLGYSTVVLGEANALTKSPRARFFGRLSPKILMNQLYQIDLVKLANYSANVEAKAKGTEPVYR